MKVKEIKADEYGRHIVFARVPELADVENLKVGDGAPNCFGGFARVTRIFARSVDKNGKAFVCYYAAMSERDTPENGCGCSASMKVGELIRTVALSGVLTSAQCDEIERELNLSDIKGA